MASARSIAMRAEFDQAFATPAADTVASTTDLLAVRVGGDAFALRLSDIAGLHVNLPVVPIPTPAQHLLGIAAIRGVMAPVYDLAGLLGYSPAPTTRWVVMVKAPQMIGLALESFEAQVRVSDLLLNLNIPDPTGRPRVTAHAQGAVQTAGALRPILQVSTLIASLQESLP
jgi:chemotaxis signal transduction protein